LYGFLGIHTSTPFLSTGSDHMNSALAGAAMISNSPGTVADITVETYRALAFSIWSIGPMNGPVTGPLIGGFAAEYLGWRWTNWLVLIFSAVGWIMCACIKETYAPIILQKKAAKMRKETGDDRWWSRYDQNSTGKHYAIFDKASSANSTLVTEILKVNLSRPFVLTFTEPILWFWDAYIAVCLQHSFLFTNFPASCTQAYLIPEDGISS
jgi:MFS family permease